ncbi:MAG TPA: heparan-alpha-glucosaminide N-acetyltransferase domain-containing protein [Chitinophagaceae bacterium]|nr:heparan-alpha-glucosaminide N-acetyltransferase domain-containing protein [Chitinophagaceae bacterium]
MQTTAIKSRIQSIDVLRGTVMVIMALDHVRDFLYKSPLTKAADAALDPTNMQTTFPALFFTRWITHFCAPVFVFLAGTSIYLMSQRKSKKELSAFLIKRGVWLVIVELVIITFGWTFNPFYNLFILQVIWAIGISMILLGLFIYLPYKIILAIGLLIVAGHNVMNIVSISNELKGSVLANLIYFSNFSFYSIDQTHFFVIIYAFLPWTGVMLLGYSFGKLYDKNVDVLWRRKTLLKLGLTMIGFFLFSRAINFYGDPLPWHEQPRGSIYSFLSFLNLTKYPPSLLFLCMTLGPAILSLAFIEKIKNKFTEVINVYGKVPMLYYILHFYLIHIIVIIVFYAQGFGEKDIVPSGLPFFFKPNGLGFSLWGVYAVWLVVVILLYPVCKKYNQYKSTHNKWWLSYL